MCYTTVKLYTQLSCRVMHPALIICICVVKNKQTKKPAPPKKNMIKIWLSLVRSSHCRSYLSGKPVPYNKSQPNRCCTRDGALTHWWEMAGTHFQMWRDYCAGCTLCSCWMIVQVRTTCFSAYYSDFVPNSCLLSSREMKSLSSWRVDIYRWK